MSMNVAIDGPAGAGKSTIAKMVAKKIGFIYVDTGALYRTMTLACIRKGLTAQDVEDVIQVCREIEVGIQYVDGEQNVLLNGENVSSLIRTEQVSAMTSAISAIPEVREILLDVQRDIAKKENVIMDGRDIGSNILPNAQVKIYLTASVHTRALRRYKEQVEKGFTGTIEEIEKEIEQRDYRDSHRACAPLTVAKGATVVDSSDMSIEEVVACLEKLIEEGSKL